MRVLGIETSCDETGIALYDSKAGLLANRVYSQAPIHSEFGGVIPELASRDHVKKILPLISLVLISFSFLTAKRIIGGSSDNDRNELAVMP